MAKRSLYTILFNYLFILQNTPADRVHFILGQENDDLDGCSHESHPLFSELAELSVHNDELEWRETAR